MILGQARTVKDSGWLRYRATSLIALNGRIQTVLCWGLTLRRILIPHTPNYPRGGYVQNVRPTRLNHACLAHHQMTCLDVYRAPRAAKGLMAAHMWAAYPGVFRVTAKLVFEYA